jgi:hypothetical protein
MYKFCLYLFCVSISISSFGQDKELKKAYEEFQLGQVTQSLATLDNYYKNAKKVEADDAVLYYWVFTHALAADGPDQKLKYSHKLTGDFMSSALMLKNSDEKAYSKMVEKYGCSIEKEQELINSIDDRISYKYLEATKVGGVDKRDIDDYIDELYTFIQDYPSSTHLYEMSDRIDELRVRQALLNSDESAVERFTRIESYNTPPVDLSRKAEIFNKNIKEVTHVLQGLLEEKALKSRSSVDMKNLKAKFPDSKVIGKIQRELTEQVLTNVQGLLNFNKVDLIHFRKKPSGEPQENITTDIMPEEFNVAAYDGVKLVAITQVVSESAKYTVKKFYFNQNQEVVAIEASVKPLFYELPVNANPVKEENSKIYFYEGEVVFTEGSLLSKSDLMKGNELKKRSDLNFTVEPEKRTDLTLKFFNPYNWTTKPTHTIVYNQDGYNVSIAIACVDVNPEMSVEGEAVVTLKKGSFEQKFRIEAAFPFLQQQFISGVYRLAESEIAEFPFLQFKDCNFDGIADLGMNETAGSYDAGMTWYTWREASKSFVLDYQMLDLYFGGELTFSAEDKSIVVFTFQDGTSETTYRYDNGLWRDVNDTSSFTEYDEETENAYGVSYHRFIKSGQIVIENSRELLTE